MLYKHLASVYYGIFNAFKKRWLSVIPIGLLRPFSLFNAHERLVLVNAVLIPS